MYQQQGGHPADTDFFSSQYGLRRRYSWMNRRLGPVTDWVWARGLSLVLPRVRRSAGDIPVQRVLLASVEVPARKGDLDRVVAEMKRSRHEITVMKAPLGENKGKFQNLAPVLDGIDLQAFDWLIVIDDDVALPSHFMDDFLYVAVKTGFKICMPAHRFYSYFSYVLTRRHLATIARRTGFVECGPITAFHRDTLSFILPFPDLRWAWGIDIAWSVAALDKDIPIGIIDATPIRHLRPVAGSYGGGVAHVEAEGFLKREGIAAPKLRLLRTLRTIRAVD